MNTPPPPPMDSKTYFWQYKALVWIRKSSERISSYACPASYRDYVS
ncbi:MAG: hypothetical protein ACMUEL_01505 [Flavobacteriales bacterium Tduv]